MPPSVGTGAGRRLGRSHPLLKKIRLAASGSRRSESDLVVAEGVRVLEEVHAAGCRVEAVVTGARFGEAGRERALLELWRARAVPRYTVDESVLGTLSDVRAPQGALALVRVPSLSLAQLPEPGAGPIVCAFGLQDPGNLGTLIRAAAAAGAAFVCTAEGTVSARNPKVLRSSAGAFFRIPVVERLDPEEFLRYAGVRSIAVYCADASTGTPYTRADLRGRCAFVLGNEGRGTKGAGLESLPALHIPMARATESLNVAMAGSIILFEAARQRALGPPP
jgi:TrmH family RNA methyltransferase